MQSPEFKPQSHQKKKKRKEKKRKMRQFIHKYIIFLDAEMRHGVYAC
jgi:hypothetical protein